jgi:glutathione-regulated potassium-efflux system ancillary protein KefC
VLGGRYLLRPVFRMIAATRLREVFTAVSLLVVLGAALLMDLVGMSMALGTFLAGVLLAESEYRHAIESDIEPFKGLLLGLFFISVGMAVDFGLLFAHPLLVLGLVVGVVGIKIAVLALVGRQARLPRGQTLLFAILPSQGSEFAFVLFAMAAAGGLMAAQMQSLLILVVALSLVTTPLLLIAYERVIAPRLVDQAAAGKQSVEDEQSPVLIAGFGRFGQIIGRLLNANGIATTVLDHDPQHIETIRRFGFKVFYGDAARLDLLHAAGAARAKVLVVAVDDRESALKIVELARQHFPNLTLLTRAWDVVHAFELMERNVNCVEREAFEGALKVGEEALRRLGLSAWQAKQATHRFRAHDEELLSELFSHFKEDVSVRAAISASARERLREQMEADEAEFGDGRDTDWR